MEELENLMSIFMWSTSFNLIACVCSLINHVTCRSHHEKLVIIDYQICFIGGLDLCFGRYDTIEHRVGDCSADIWPGKDYYNPRYFSFLQKIKLKWQLWFSYIFGAMMFLESCNILLAHMWWLRENWGQISIVICNRYGSVEACLQNFVLIFPQHCLARESEPNSWEDVMKDELDRRKYPRMPWHDVHCSLWGPPCRDIARHFVQRWNHAKVNFMIPTSCVIILHWHSESSVSYMFDLFLEKQSTKWANNSTTDASPPHGPSSLHGKKYRYWKQEWRRKPERHQQNRLLCLSIPNPRYPFAFTSGSWCNSC